MIEGKQACSKMEVGLWHWHSMLWCLFPVGFIQMKASIASCHYLTASKLEVLESTQLYPQSLARFAFGHLCCLPMEKIIICHSAGKWKMLYAIQEFVVMQKICCSSMEEACCGKHQPLQQPATYQHPCSVANLTWHLPWHSRTYWRSLRQNSVLAGLTILSRPSTTRNEG